MFMLILAAAPSPAPFGTTMHCPPALVVPLQGLAAGPLAALKLGQRVALQGGHRGQAH